jgi:molybdopterin synthase sulfur carrier subunit
MSLRVRFFASLRDAMGRDEETLPGDGVRTVADVWACVSGGMPLSDHVLCSINMEYAVPESPVQDGDEIAFFPPVTGG